MLVTLLILSLFLRYIIVDSETKPEDLSGYGSTFTGESAGRRRSSRLQGKVKMYKY